MCLEDTLCNVRSGQLTTTKEPASKTLVTLCGRLDTVKLNIHVALWYQGQLVSCRSEQTQGGRTRDILSTLIRLTGPYLLSTSPLMSSAMSKSQFLSVSL